MFGTAGIENLNKRHQGQKACVVNKKKNDAKASAQKQQQTLLGMNLNTIESLLKCPYPLPLLS